MTATPADVEDEWGFLGRRVLVVSPFPPAQDGIARYAVQLIEVLSGERTFRRLGIPEGGGDRQRALHRGARALGLLAEARGFDDVLVHYHPHYYMRGGYASRLACYASWALLVRLRAVTFVMHEVDDLPHGPLGRRGRAMFALEEWVRRRLWARAARVVFHSDWEQRRFEARFSQRPARNDTVVRQGGFYSTGVSVERAQARQRLGLAGDRVILLMIGFLSRAKPDKGYDRAIRALGEAAEARAELHIVGSPIRSGPETQQLVADLERAAAELPDVHLHLGFVSDEDFDLWVRAADAVLTPYAGASSSAVTARAHLLDTRVITSGAGGLAEQLGPDDILAQSDADLAAAIRRVATEAAAA